MNYSFCRPGQNSIAKKQQQQQIHNITKTTQPTAVESNPIERAIFRKSNRREKYSSTGIARNAHKTESNPSIYTLFPFAFLFQ